MTTHDSLLAAVTELPFGGIEKSGYGLEFGMDGLEAAAVTREISG